METHLIYIQTSTLLRLLLLSSCIAWSCFLGWSNAGAGSPPDKAADNPLPDRIHFLDSNNNDFLQEVVVMTNGIINVPPPSGTGTPTWVNPSAFKGRTLFNMPENRLQTGPTCQHTGADPCTFEVSAFTRDNAMALATPPPQIPWTDNLGDEVRVIFDRDLLTIPVRFYVLWQKNPLAPQNVPCNELSSPTTECMAEQWREVANALFWDQSTGLQFKRPASNPIILNTSNSNLFDASCLDLDAIYGHFQIDPTNAPDSIRVFFVRTSTAEDPHGNRVQSAGWTCQSGPSSFTLNDIIISTSLASSTTLAHEFGHSLSLDDINDVLGDGQIKPHARGLKENNLMYSGSPNRNSLSKAQSFRANVNQFSAIHQHKSLGRVSSNTPRLCHDSVSNLTCPSLGLDK